LLLMGICLLIWAAIKVGGVGAILKKSDELAQARSAMSSNKFVLNLFIPWLTAMVGYWATLSLNIPDFTRYAKSQKDQMLGQTIGLLTTMPLFAFIGIAVTGATLILYGEAIWNPVTLLAKLTEEYQNPLMGLLSMFVLIVATLSTNIAANVVSPANSISNLNPQKINFRLGGLIAAVIGIVILPWKLLDMYQSWLISYSGLLGAAVGVIICDYVIIRKKTLNLHDLYLTDGEYAYRNGFNRTALIALMVGIAVALLGKVHPNLQFLFNGAWFSAAFAAFIIYYFLMKKNHRSTKS
ncbi:MAG: cytosine permease, partial [Anaerolineae bacterium]